MLGFFFVLYYFLYRKNSFTEVSKNVAKYKSENNFIELLK